MDQVPFTVKPLKVLKNSSGLRKELEHSQIVHSKNIPILISSHILRSRNLGQIDMAIINCTGELVIFEVKSSLQGSHLKYQQHQRLKNALHFLCLIFNRAGRLQVLK